ncbi:MAG: HNH endonuclease [Alphaproteobacteria bacterium]
MTVIFTRQSTQKTHEMRKEFRHINAAKDFLNFLLDNGYLERIKNRINIDKTRRGKVPKNFDIHHIIPLSGGGSNALSNLCLIEKSFHKFLNRYCFDPALKNIQEGETVQIDIPDLPPVALYHDFLPFINETLQKPSRQTTFKRLIQIPLKKLTHFTNWHK